MNAQPLCPLSNGFNDKAGHDIKKILGKIIRGQVVSKLTETFWL